MYEISDIICDTTISGPSDGLQEFVQVYTEYIRKLFDH